MQSNHGLRPHPTPHHLYMVEDLYNIHFPFRIYIIPLYIYVKNVFPFLTNVKDLSNVYIGSILMSPFMSMLMNPLLTTNPFEDFQYIYNMVTKIKENIIVNASCLETQLLYFSS